MALNHLFCLVFHLWSMFQQNVCIAEDLRYLIQINS